MILLSNRAIYESKSVRLMQPTHKHNAVIVRTPADLKKKKKKEPHLSLTNFNGDWTEWNPVRSGIIRKTDIKIGRTQTGGTFVNHENNFRQYFYDGKAVTNLSKQGQLLRNNTYQLNVFRTNIYGCFFFLWKNEPIVDLTKCKSDSHRPTTDSWLLNSPIKVPGV